MQAPTVGSKIKVRTRYSQGLSMIPPQPAFNDFEGIVLKPYKWLNDRQFCLSGNDEWPIRVIDLMMVEDLQVISGELKTIDIDSKIWTVSGSKGNKYTVTRNAAKWDCTCPGFSFRKTCKHVSELSGVK